MNIGIKGQIFPQPNSNFIGQEPQLAKNGSFTAGQTGAATQSDQVTLSKAAVHAQKLQSALAEQPIVDSNRVAKVKKAINENTYEIDPVRVSQKLALFETALNNTI